MERPILPCRIENCYLPRGHACACRWRTVDERTDAQVAAAHDDGPGAPACTCFTCRAFRASVAS